MATHVTVNAGQGSTQVTVITGEGSTSYLVSAGSRGPTGATGATGAAGPNSITTSTTSNLTGFIAANGTAVNGATAGATAATANTLALRDATGGSNFAAVGATSVTATSAGNDYAIKGTETTGDGVSGYGALGVYGEGSMTGVAGNGIFEGVAGSSNNGIGVGASSTNGDALVVATTAGTNHARFGETGIDRSFVARVKGAFGWIRGAFTGRIHPPDTLTADCTYTLPDKSGTVAMIDAETHTGAHAFSSTTRPTSAGTGTPAATSLITLDDADARYRQQSSPIFYAAQQDTAQVVTNSTSYVDSAALVNIPAGTYFVRSSSIVLNSSTTGLSKTRLAFSGTGASATRPFTFRAFSTATDAASLSPQLFSQTSTLHAWNREEVNFGTNRGMMIIREFIFTCTGTGNLSAQFAMNVASGVSDTATMVAGSFIIAQRIS